MQEHNGGGFFRKPFFNIIQFYLLKLKHEYQRFRLLHHIDRCTALTDTLRKKEDIKLAIFRKEVLKLHEVLRLKIKNLKANGLRNLLFIFLYDIQPENEAQRLLLPQISIYLTEEIEISFSLEVRKGTRAYQLKRGVIFEYEKLREDIARF